MYKQDIETIDALCEAIRNFEGGVVVVSHDARLIETTECRLWVVGDQTVEEFDGRVICPSNYPPSPSAPPMTFSHFLSMVVTPITYPQQGVLRVSTDGPR